LDLGCGQGGDIQKFYYASILSYVGIDPDYDNIFAYGKSQSRYERFKKNKKQYPNFPPMTFLQGSATSLLTYEDQIKEIGKMNNEQKKSFDRFFGENNKTYFDRFNSSMSVHYYLKNETAWLNFCENVNKYLRSGGYFIFEVMDGEIIKEKLKDKDTYQLFYDTVKGEKKLLFEIKKKYNDNSIDMYGNTIDVHMSWISEENIFNSEYLVNYDFIVKSLKDNCNLELIESDYFKTIYEDSYGYINSVCENEKMDNVALGNLNFISKVKIFYEDNLMNKVHKEISDLYRYYVFKKTETDLKEVKQKYYGKKSTIFTAK
jgi:SAM-dependent methyltransferase